MEGVRERLREYMARSGMSCREIAEETGYARNTIVQFVSSSHFGTSDRETGGTAAKLAQWMEENQLPARQAPGRLYETAATRAMDRLLDWGRGGGWGILYGPAGRQKTFLLKTRAAQAVREAEPSIALIEVSGEWSAFTLFKHLAAELGIGAIGPHTEDLRSAILRAVRRRRSPLALVLDEADLLYPRIDTLQAVRRFGDISDGRVGLIVVGNEQVERLFEPRKNSYMEQWRSRIDQERLRVVGPTRDEAAAMIVGEAPDLSDEKVGRLLDGCTVHDPVSNKDYVNVRRLFNTLRRRPGNSRAN